MVVVGFALRFGWIIVAHTYKFKALDDNFSFGWEMGRIGRSLALGQGFSNPFNADDRTDRMGAATLSVSDRRCLQAIRHLHPRLSDRLTGPQQSFFCANLHSHFPDCQTVFRRKVGDLDCLVVGGDAARHVLVHALGVGNEPGGFSARTDFLADA